MLERKRVAKKSKMKRRGDRMERFVERNELSFGDIEGKIVIVSKRDTCIEHAPKGRRGWSKESNIVRIAHSSNEMVLSISLKTKRSSM